MRKVTTEMLQNDIKKIVENIRILSRNLGELEFRIQMGEMQITGIKKKLEDIDNHTSVVNKDLTI
jgi:hypothetical protein